MGAQIRITMRDTSENYLDGLNKELEQLGIKKSCFITMAENQAWLDNLNQEKQNRPYCFHAKPYRDRDITLDELCDAFKLWTTVGQAEFDVAFGRTPESELDAWLKFLDKHKDEVLVMTDIDRLVEDAPHGDKFAHLKGAFDNGRIEPTYLPESDQLTVWSEGGVAEIAGVNDSRVIVIYAKVDSPRYMQQRTFADNDKAGYSENLIKTNDGKSVLQVPLMPLGDRQWVERVHEDLRNLLIKEGTDSLFYKLYGLEPSKESGWKFNNNREQDECIETVRRKNNCSDSADALTPRARATHQAMMAGRVAEWLFNSEKERQERLTVAKTTLQELGDESDTYSVMLRNIAMEAISDIEACEILSEADDEIELGMGR